MYIRLLAACECLTCFNVAQAPVEGAEGAPTAAQILAGKAHDDVSEEPETRGGQPGNAAEEGGEASAFAHEWNPAACISVPGTVFGVGFRCTCAHGAVAAAKARGRDDGAGEGAGQELAEGEGDGRGGMAVLCVRGCEAPVVCKVVACCVYTRLVASVIVGQQ